MIWVKGHTSVADVLKGRLSYRWHCANVLADRWAGRGAELAKAMAPNEDLLAEYARISAFYTLLVRLCINWPQDYAKDREKADKLARPKKSDKWKVNHESPHEPWRLLDGRVKCALCGTTTRASRGPAVVKFVRQACRVGGPRGEGCRRGGVGLEHLAGEARTDLAGRGALRLPVLSDAPLPQSASSGSARTLSKFMPVLEIRDLRADNAKFLNCMVGLNGPAGCINACSRDGKSLRMLSGIRGGDV